MVLQTGVKVKKGGLVQRLSMCVIAGILLLSSLAQAQVRSQDDMLTDIDLLFDILTAVVNRINVDDADTIARDFPGRTFAEFDRDRSGNFMQFAAALGLYDLNLAITQFNHDPVDADGDGLIGFYELECEYAGGVSLDPTTSETRAGIPDGQVDCDGDGVANLVEVNAGTDPLDPDSFPENDFEVSDPNVGTQPLTVGTPDGETTLTLEPATKHRFQGNGYTLDGEFVQ